MGPRHRHKSFIAFAGHRLSGLALALFLPVHFWALSKALNGEAELEAFLQWSNNPLVKFAEWGLVILLTLHLCFGLRLLVVEFGPVRKLHNNLVTASAIGALVAGAIFVIRVF